MTLKCDTRSDPVDRMIRDLTPEEVAEWLIKYHGLPEASRRTVELNIGEQFRWHRLRGRLDRSPTLAALFNLLALRKAPPNDGGNLRHEQA